MLDQLLPKHKIAEIKTRLLTEKILKIYSYNILIIFDYPIVYHNQKQMSIDKLLKKQRTLILGVNFGKRYFGSRLAQC